MRGHWRRNNALGEGEFSLEQDEMGPNVEPAHEATVRTDSDGVLVVSVWLEGEGGFLGRMTATTPHGGSAVVVVSSPDDLLEEIATWLRGLR